MSRTRAPYRAPEVRNESSGALAVRNEWFMTLPSVRVNSGGRIASDAAVECHTGPASRLSARHDRVADRPRHQTFGAATPPDGSRRPSCTGRVGSLTAHQSAPPSG